jgi:hypothetical protein
MQAIFTMLRTMPEYMNSYIPTLLAAVIGRLEKAKLNMTITGLIMVRCHALWGISCYHGVG